MCIFQMLTRYLKTCPPNECMDILYENDNRMNKRYNLLKQRHQKYFYEYLNLFRF
jgi:hypothetical protein